MAIFRVPRITTAQRLELTLIDGELVYDTDKKIFYGGDGLTEGGYPVGVGIPEGGGEGYVLVKSSSVDFDTEWVSQSQLVPEIAIETFTLDHHAIQTKKVMLTTAPKSSQSLRFVPEGGLDQRLGIDFDVDERAIIWGGLTLDGFLEAGDIIRVIYQA